MKVKLIFIAVNLILFSDLLHVNYIFAYNVSFYPSVETIDPEEEIEICAQGVFPPYSWTVTNDDLMLNTKQTDGCVSIKATR